MPGDVVDFAASVGLLSVTFTWTPPSFLGVPPTLDPADFIYYILDVTNGMDSVGGATVPHPITTVMVNLTYPCEEYTATIFARNRQAGNGPPTMETFTQNETSVWQPNETLVAKNVCCSELDCCTSYICAILGGVSVKPVWFPSGTVYYAELTVCNYIRS